MSIDFSGIVDKTFGSTEVFGINTQITARESCEFNEGIRYPGKFGR